MERGVSLATQLHCHRFLNENLKAMRKVALQAMRKVALQAMRKALSILVTKYKEGAPTRPQNVSAMVCKK